MIRLRQLLKSTLQALLPRTRLLLRGPQTPIHGRPTVALTFDDGPHPVHTPEVLEQLQKWQLKGTFFIVGQRAEEHPELVQRILSEGHQLANHTWTHAEPAQQSAEAFFAELDRTNAFLRQLTGMTPDWMRPPKGELTAAKGYGLWRRGARIALWSDDPRDYRLETPADVAAVARTTTWTSCAVVLLHDNRPGAALLLEHWGQAGRWSEFHAVTLSDWMPFTPHTTAASPLVLAQG